MHSVTIRYYGAKIYGALRKIFPHSIIVIETWTEATERGILDNRIHIGVNFLNPERTKQIYQKKLLETNHVIAVSTSHEANTWEEVINYPFIQIKIAGWNDNKRHFADICEKNGVYLNFKLRTDDLTALQKFVAEDNMAIVTLRNLMDEDEFKFIEIPDKFRIDLAFATCIKLANRSNPLHMEIEKAIKDIIK
nr:LysR family transcriptional regulator substrate-binding protein [Aliivibrio fischeri]